MSDYGRATRQNALTLDGLDDPLIFETVQDFSGGEDSFRRSTLLDPNQCQHLQNVLVRDNYEARTRPGADAIPTANTHPVANSTAVYALRYFDTPTYQQLLVSCPNGNTPQFAKYEGGAWTDLSGSYTPASANARLAMEQAVNKVLIGDGSANQLKVYDGAAFAGVGTDAQYDAPIGATILCWHTSRMFASGQSANPDTLYVSVFQPKFVPKGTAGYAGDWDSVNRSFRVGVGDGDPIVAVASMQDFSLAVLKRNSIWLITTDPAADSSATAGFTASQVTKGITQGLGCVGRDAWCSYGNDVLFMAQDGVRSVQRMQAAAGQWQLSAPISQPIQPLIDRINRGAWDKICAIKYQELALFFVPLDNATSNNAVLVWNGRLGKWMGTWTNWTGLCCEQTRFLGTPRLVFGDNAGLVNLWKDNLATNGVTDDATYLDNGAYYPTQVWTKSYQFGEEINNKTAYNIISFFTAGNAPVMLSFVTDLFTATNWTSTVQPDGDILGIGTLPFKLQSQSPVRFSKGVRNLNDFNEAYVRAESLQGWFFLRSISMGAFVNALKEI